MTALSKTSLIASLESAAAQAGLTVQAVSAGKDFNGEPTTIFQLGLANAVGRSLQLELSEAFDFDKPNLLPEVTAHLTAEARRLRNPRPECYVTLAGLPIAFGKFQWPFHRSISGADTYVVHGEMHLADGGASNLHAKVAASVTVTFAEIVPAMEQPYAETFVYNAIRKTVDLGQLEFVKSGNRQPVPVTTRYYSRWQKKFLFTETNDAERLEYLLRKVYWLSGVLGENKPVWIADPRDAQYLNTTEADLLRMAGHEAGEGLMTLDGDYAAATPALLTRAAEYQSALEAALNFTKPHFNESMRAGEANM
ncbi:MAG TPA: hypothetical protein VK720_09680 [Terracidiphilus sp.]|jgi:hypothetical protein|nr:hypothetical protein [Terracidiphilus sp.]